MLRERTTPFPTGTPHAAPWELNRELLMPESRRLLFVVELVAGHPPETGALDDLVRLASRYGERPAAWVQAGQAGAPKARWENDRLRADEPLSADTSYIFVRYVGFSLPGFGSSYSQLLFGRTVYLILVNQEHHRMWRSLIPERRLEEQTLVHEYGHLLGLPPAGHGYYPRYPDFSDGAHCVNPDCALSKPRLRALLYGFVNVVFRRRYLEDYCAACRSAIAAAKSYWRKRPQPLAGNY